MHLGASNRVGPVLRTPIWARGVDGRNTRPDTRQHPTTLFIATRKILLASGGASTHVPLKMPMVG